MKIIRDLDKISFKEWFLNHGGSEKSLERMWDPIAYALGFINCKDISARSVSYTHLTLPTILRV